MSGVRIEYDDSQVIAMLTAVSEKTRNMESIMRSIGTVLIERNRMRFDRQVDPDGRPWAPTKRGGQILRLTGVLFNSLQVGEVTPTSVEVGTNVPYAAAHQFGSKPYVIKPRLAPYLWLPAYTRKVSQVNHPGLKPRPFLGISPDDRDEILTILTNFLTE